MTKQYKMICNMKIFKYILSATLAMILSCSAISCSDDDKEPSVSPTASGTVTDKDGNEYHWVRIGNLDWMTENLRCDDPFYEDIYNPKWVNKWGDPLALSGTLKDWKKWYEDFGNYYSWEEAVAYAPEGWRLPTDEDFKALESELGMNKGELDREGWRSGASELMTQQGVGTMLDFRFGGEICNYSYSNIDLYHQYDYGYYWTSTNTEINKEPAAYARMITPGKNAVNRLVILQNLHFLSVRYVRDAK